MATKKSAAKTPSKTTAKKNGAKKPYVIVRSPFGTFCGFLEEHKDGTARLSQARILGYWSGRYMLTSVAALGPIKGSNRTRLSDAAPEATLPGVVGILTCSPEAAALLQAEETYKVAS